jgi:DNA-binding response OmpR family regulator
VPVVIISAMDDDESRARASAAGATAYYTKPFSPIALLKEIDRLKSLLAPRA